MTTNRKLRTTELLRVFPRVYAGTHVNHPAVSVHRVRRVHIDAGDMLFAIDQAQYLQGYLPIVLLTKYLETGALPLGSVDRVILTGPQIVTSDVAADVIQFSEQGLR